MFYYLAKEKVSSFIKRNQKELNSTFYGKLTDTYSDKQTKNSKLRLGTATIQQLRAVSAARKPHRLEALNQNDQLT